MSTISSLVFHSHALRRAARWCNAAAGELLTAAAILCCLNALATAIKRTHQTGQACGRLLKPLLQRLWQEIDWRDVAAIVITGLLLTGIGSWRLLGWSHRTLLALSEQLGQHCSALVLRMTQTSTSPASSSLSTSPPSIEATAQAVPEARRTLQPRQYNAAVAAAKQASQPQASHPKARAVQAPRGFAVSTR